jgi:integrase
MMQTVEMVSAGLIQKLRERGTHKETILNYQIVCNAVTDFCKQRTNGGNQYSPELLRQYLDYTEQCLENGEMSAGYACFKRRVVRLLEEYAETGYANFTHIARKKHYNPTDSHQELINQILDANNLTPSSRKVIDPPMRQFFCFIEEMDVKISELSDDIFFTFMDSVSEAHKGSIGRTFRALRFVSDFIKKHSLASLKADLSMLKVKAAPTKIIAPYSQDEIHRIADTIDPSTQTGMRDKAILLLAFETGLRAIDITRLKLSDIDWIKAEIYSLQSKTKTPITLPINGAVMNAVADYILLARPDSDAQEIFLTVRAPYRPLKGATSLRGRFEGYSQKANVEKKAGRSFHSIRRSYATEMSLAGVPLPTISQMLGHKSIDQDKPYLSYDKEHISHCSIDFSEVPIAGGIYVNLDNNFIAPREIGGGRR